MKLELKHIAPYLPYGLKVIHEGHVKEVHGLMNEEIYLEYNGIGTDMDGKELFEVKPLLLPLSALTEQLIDGSIPIVELAKIATKHIWGELIDFSKAELLSESDSAGLIVYYDKTERISFTADFDCTRKDFALYSDGDGLNLDKLQLFEYLFANHFDVFNLISCQLADAK